MPSVSSENKVTADIHYMRECVRWSFMMTTSREGGKSCRRIMAFSGDERAPLCSSPGEKSFIPARVWHQFYSDKVPAPRSFLSVAVSIYGCVCIKVFFRLQRAKKKKRGENHKKGENFDTAAIRKGGN